MDAQPTYHAKFTGCLIDEFGTERHFINGAYGRENDLPAVIYKDGSKHWYIENPKRGGFGQRPSLEHRDNDLPAIIKANGDQYFYQFGKLQRGDDKPAIILSNGTQKWFSKGDCTKFIIGKQFTGDTQ